MTLFSAPECSVTSVSSCTTTELTAYLYMRIDGDIDWDVECG